MPDRPFDDPFVWFDSWFQQTIRTGISDPNAMTLSTVDERHQPASRVVLLKDYGEDGFVFYTNLESRKAKEIAREPRVGLSFFWREPKRQIRIQGLAERVSDSEADEYFASRPRGSQIGAWASDQSRPLASREALMKRVREFDEKFAGEDVPRPPHWSGYRVIPHRFEFWEAGDFRLHDRFEFVRGTEDEAWHRERLFP